MLFAGLENINEVIDTDEISSLQLEVEILRHQADTSDDIHQLSVLSNTLDNIKLIRHSVEQYGVTPAIVDLVGDTSISLVSLEGIMGDTYQKIKDFIKMIIDKIVGLFKNTVPKVTSMLDKSITKLEAMKGKVDEEANKDKKIKVLDSRKIAGIIIWLRDTIEAIDTIGMIAKYKQDKADIVIDFNNNEILSFKLPKIELVDSNLSELNDDMLDAYISNNNTYIKTINTLSEYINEYKKEVASEEDEKKLKDLAFKVKVLNKLFPTYLDYIVKDITIEKLIIKKIKLTK